MRWECLDEIGVKCPTPGCKGAPRLRRDDDLFPDGFLEDSYYVYCPECGTKTVPTDKPYDAIADWKKYVEGGKKCSE
jgi:hypothetical protein